MNNLIDFSLLSAKEGEFGSSVFQPLYFQYGGDKNYYYINEDGSIGKQLRGKIYTELASDRKKSARIKETNYTLTKITKKPPHYKSYECELFKLEYGNKTDTLIYIEEGLIIEFNKKIKELKAQEQLEARVVLGSAQPAHAPKSVVASKPNFVIEDEIEAGAKHKIELREIIGSIIEKEREFDDDGVQEILKRYSERFDMLDKSHDTVAKKEIEELRLIYSKDHLIFNRSVKMTINVVRSKEMIRELINIRDKTPKTTRPQKKNEEIKALLNPHIIVPENPLSLKEIKYTDEQQNEMLDRFGIKDDFNKLRIKYYFLNENYNYNFIDVYLSLYLFIEDENITIDSVKQKIKSFKPRLVGTKLPEPTDMESYKIEDKRNIINYMTVHIIKKEHREKIFSIIDLIFGHEPLENHIENAIKIIIYIYGIRIFFEWFFGLPNVNIIGYLTNFCVSRDKEVLDVLQPPFGTNIHFRLEFAMYTKNEREYYLEKYTHGLVPSLALQHIDSFLSTIHTPLEHRYAVNYLINLKFTNDMIDINAYADMIKDLNIQVKKRELFVASLYKNENYKSLFKVFHEISNTKKSGLDEENISQLIEIIKLIHSEVNDIVQMKKIFVIFLYYAHGNKTDNLISFFFTVLAYCDENMRRIIFSENEENILNQSMFYGLTHRDTVEIRYIKGANLVGNKGANLVGNELLLMCETEIKQQMPFITALRKQVDQIIDEYFQKKKEEEREKASRREKKKREKEEERKKYEDHATLLEKAEIDKYMKTLTSQLSGLELDQQLRLIARSIQAVGEQYLKNHLFEIYLNLAFDYFTQKSGEINKLMDIFGSANRSILVDREIDQSKLSKLLKSCNTNFMSMKPIISNMKEIYETVQDFDEKNPEYEEQNEGRINGVFEKYKEVTKYKEKAAHIKNRLIDHIKDLEQQESQKGTLEAKQKRKIDAEELEKKLKGDNLKYQYINGEIFISELSSDGAYKLLTTKNIDIMIDHDMDDEIFPNIKLYSATIESLNSMDTTYYKFNSVINVFFRHKIEILYKLLMNLNEHFKQYKFGINVVLGQPIRDFVYKKAFIFLTCRYTDKIINLGHISIFKTEVAQPATAATAATAAAATAAAVPAVVQQHEPNIHYSIAPFGEIRENRQDNLPPYRLCLNRSSDPPIIVNCEPRGFRQIPFQEVIIDIQSIIGRDKTMQIQTNDYLSRIVIEFFITEFFRLIREKILQYTGPTAQSSASQLDAFASPASQLEAFASPALTRESPSTAQSSASQLDAFASPSSQLEAFASPALTTRESPLTAAQQRQAWPRQAWPRQASPALTTTRPSPPPAAWSRQASPALTTATATASSFEASPARASRASPAPAPAPGGYYFDTFIHHCY